jgi:hypothetical protein
MGGKERKKRRKEERKMCELLVLRDYQMLIGL